MSFFEDLPTKSICISHSRDVDGIVSAAMIRHVINCGVFLTDYDGLIQTLQMVDGATNLMICDLGTTKETEFQFLHQLKQVAKTTGICYIDHHPLSTSLMDKLSEIGVRLIHSNSDCAAAITYELYKDKLPKDAALLASCAAVTDEMENGPIAKRILARYDKDLVMLEGSMLSYGIAAKGDDDQFLLKLTEELASFRLPHQIPDLCHYACEYSERMLELGAKVLANAIKMKSMGHMETQERNLGSVANSIIGELGVPLGVAYRYKPDTDKYIISLRTSGSFRGHLGELTSEIAAKVQGIGGGHHNASGAVIPIENLQRFLTLIDHALDK